MDITPLILMTAFVMLSVMPLLRIDVWGRIKRYQRFVIVNLVLVVWGYMIFLQLFGRLHDAPWLYQSNHLLLMAFVFFFFFAVRFYRTEKPSPILMTVFIIMLFIDLSITIMIPPREAFMTLSSVENLFRLMDYPRSYIRYFFILEAMIMFFILGYTIVSLMVDVFDRYREDKLFWPPMVQVMSYITCLFIVLLNADGLIFGIDGLYGSLVILTSSLYASFFLSDPYIIIRASKSKFILEMIDQMYVIADIKERVIHASESFKKRFDIKEKTYSLSHLIQIIKKDHVLLGPGETIDYFDNKKSYYRIKKNEITFPLSKNEGMLLLIEDITKSQRMSYEMDYVMNHDLMTGLHNRNFFESIKPHVERHNGTYALILMDLDGLKVYNDILGHKAGDRLIKRFASAMTNIAEKYRNTLTIRLGGDEFLLLPKSKSHKEIDHMIKDLKHLCKSESMEESIGFSYGIEYKTSDTDESISTLLGMADEHLYKMKDNHEKKKEELRHFLLDQYTKPSSNHHEFN